MKNKYYPGDKGYEDGLKKMIGKVFTVVEESSADREKDVEIIFKNKEETFSFFHEQECCESVGLEDVCGDLSDLVGTPLLKAELRKESGRPYDDFYSFTWSFYEFATIKGSVTIRWYGESNGYYSEEVTLVHQIGTQEDD